MDDDVVILEEIRSQTLTKRSAPLREIEIVDEPGPSTSHHSHDENLDLHTNNTYTDYAKLQQLEQLIARARANSGDRRSPKVAVPKISDIPEDYVVDDVSIIGDNVDEGVTRKKMRKEPSETTLQRKKERFEAQLQRKKERAEACLQKQLEKKRKALEREKSAAINSRCEQYMYCHVPRLIFESFEDFELHTRMEFLERNIQDQLICDEDRGNMQIFWYRKGFDVEEEDGKIEKREYEILQHVFAVVIQDDTFKELVKSKSLEDFVASQKLSYSVPNSTLVIIIFGKQSRNLFELSISLFDNFRTQLNYVNDAKGFATYLAQITRSLAKMERRLMHADRLIVGVEKGIKDAQLDELIRDWWNKMLAVVNRLQDAHRRAIIAMYPDPILASKRLLKMGYKRAVEEIAEIQSENGRRLGPVMAHRLVMMLTDFTGNEIVA